MPLDWRTKRPVGPSPLRDVLSKPRLTTDPLCAGLQRGNALRSVRGFKSTCAVDAAQPDLPDFTGLLDQEVGRADGPEVPGAHGQNLSLPALSAVTQARKRGGEAQHGTVKNCKVPNTGQSRTAKYPRTHPNAKVCACAAAVMEARCR